MKRVALADVLWDAANVHLIPDVGGHLEFSCCAVGAALGIDYIHEWGDVKLHPATRFLCRLGCDVGSLDCFEDIDVGLPRQGVRYMWLLLAMHVAEDEGIEIERGAA